MKILLLQLDGKMPNIALMRISAHHKKLEDEVEFHQVRRADSKILEKGFFHRDRVYASLIFTKSQYLAKIVKRSWPNAIVGGTGWSFQTLEEYGITTTEYDWDLYPSCRSSIGYTQRGCRLNCGFCVVPKKEGKVKPVATIYDIWRGDPWPREILLLDNDFFGQPEWIQRISELKEGKFKVSFNQGINARMLSDEAASAIASVDYRADDMKRKRIYTAWDNIGDEKVLFRGLNALVKYGVKPDEIMVYMLIGYSDTKEDREYRRKQLRSFGCRPYPMPFERTPELVGFQRWVIGAYDKRISWSDWEKASFRPERLK